MKKHQMFKSAAIIAILLAFVFVVGLVISCAEPENTGAKLTSITISGIKANKIPTPIPFRIWNDDDEDFSDPEYTETVYLNTIDDFTDVVIKVGASAGAKVTFGLSYGFDRPDTFSSNNTLDIINGQALYVRVTSEDGKTTNFYRFDIRPKSANSQLSTLKVGTLTADLGRPATTWNGVTNTNKGSLNLSNALKTNAQLVGTPVVSTATVKYAVPKPTTATPVFSDTDTYTFADGDVLYVEVTAENKTDVSYYKIDVLIGRDATLLSVKIGGEEADTLGIPRKNWGNGRYTADQRGTCQAPGKMPAEGFTVEIVPTDSEAIVEWTKITPPKAQQGNDNVDVTCPTEWDGTSPCIFPMDASDLVIFVTSSNGQNTNYYRVRFIAKSYGVVYYGTPRLDDPDNPSNNKYIDPIWNDETLFTDEGEDDMKGWLDVSRINTAESFSAWFNTEEGQHTKARAKVLWDEDGVWSYWDIDFKIPYKNATTEVTTRPASLSGAASTYTPGTDVTNQTNSVPGDAHTRDSVEFFVNERYQTYKSGNYGNQYRAGLPNADGTIWLSGEKGNPPTNPNFNPITKFQIDKMVRSWVKNDGTKDTGYVIIMRVPWVHYGEDDDLVFDNDKKVIDGAEIGLELQVNACLGTSRNGILTWNGVTSQAYQNVKSFGIVELKKTKE